MIAKEGNTGYHDCIFRPPDTQRLVLVELFYDCDHVFKQMSFTREEGGMTLSFFIPEQKFYIIPREEGVRMSFYARCVARTHDEMISIVEGHYFKWVREADGKIVNVSRMFWKECRREDTSPLRDVKNVRDTSFDDLDDPELNKAWRERSCGPDC